MAYTVTQTSDEVLKQKLKDAAFDLKAKGFDERHIADYLTGVAADHNSDYQTDFTIGELNDFLWQHNLPTQPGNRNDRVV